MSTSGLQASDGQNAKELDSMKESISDIINQLQDIDPARLSFSPFLDLDTQICMAPVSDSPESSVEELHSSSHSASGSLRSLEPPPPLADEPKSSCLRRPDDGVHLSQSGDTDEAAPDQTLSTPITTERNLDGATENRISAPTPDSHRDIPNGTDAPRWSPESINPDSTADESRPLIGSPPESVELTVWSPERAVDTQEGPHETPPGVPRRCKCRCCHSGRVLAFISMLASFLCAAGILYALYFYVHIRPPDCPDVASRVVFTLCCCVVAALPVLLAMLAGAACRFCSASFSWKESPPGRHTVQQLFVTASLELLFLYVLNLVVMATLLPQHELKLVPILVAMFILGRLIYWASLNACSSWRGFGSGLTVFPLLAMVALNLYLLYTLNLKQPLFGSRDVLLNQVTPSPWTTAETSQSPRSGKPDMAATDFLDSL
nr:transmembrane protein 79-like isoform X2 [Doryrhamphus excisus]XP_057929178.1 transmembrane protein 79-like isoform X2 [Doryrhamphus excisus]